MEPMNILVISTNPDLLEVVLRLINQRSGWNGVGVDNPDDALEMFRHGDYRIVLFGVGFDAATERTLAGEMAGIDPEVIMIQHYGGGSGLLYNEIQAALDQGRTGVMIDDAHQSPA